MLRVLGCVTDQHDLWLVLVAAVICGLASVTALNLFARGQRATESGRGGLEPAGWRLAAAAAFGGGTWATHFIAMLAYRPGLPFGFAVPLTLVSLLLAVVGSLCGFSLMAQRPGSAPARIAAGLMVGLSVAVMHFTGMAALRLPARIEYDLPTCLVAVAIGALLASAALLAQGRGRGILAPALLALGVCATHFIAMSAITLVPDAGIRPRLGGLGQGQLALAVALVAMLILACSLLASVLDSRRTRQLQTEAKRLRRLLDSTFEGILFHHDGIVTEVNASLCALLGVGREQLLGHPVEAVLAGAHLPTPDPNGAAVSRETELRDAAGRPRPIEVLARSLTDAGRGENVIAVRDLTERRHAEQRIQHLAQHDSLTGIANRALFDDMARQSLALADRNGRAVALLSIDLDGFKAANDLLGHRAGDELLQAAANRIAGAARQTDTVARIGGDEFAVLLSLGGEPQPAAALAGRIIGMLAQPFVIDGHSLSIGASIGIALYPGDARTIEDLLRCADLAQYRAKQDGKGAYRFFEPAMDAQMKQRRQLELDLRSALANNEFEVHYQAQFDTVTLAEVGYEALLRWNHPLHGRVSPAVFIPIAENAGLIREIGHWVLETACREAATWTRPLRISVNLSPAQFKWRDLSQQIFAILDASGLPPRRLELEITEGVLVEDIDRALAVLRELKLQGVRMALDDFGTGYSSLSYLRRFPFDSLKIDKSFVQAIGEDAEANAIVRAVIALGRSLNLDVIAEGVETQQQLAHLRAQHCHMVQGFLLARPVPAAELHRAAQQAAQA